MPLVLKNRVQETTTTTGTGTVTLSGTAPTGFQTFSNALSDGDTTYYQITDGTDWEIGLGTFISGTNELQRTTVFESTNNDAKVDWGSGDKDVFVVMPASFITDVETDVTTLESDLSTLESTVNNLSPDPTKGSLTKSFTSGETATITLSSSAAPAPLVSVTKEVPQNDIVSKGSWDVDATASNYDYLSGAYSGKGLEKSTQNLNPDAFDLSALSFVASLSIAAKDSSPTQIFFKPDGTKLFWTGTSGDKVYEYALSTAWDISTATSTSEFSIAGQNTEPSGLYISPDGLNMYTTGSSTDVIAQYLLSTAWDVTTASFVREIPSDPSTSVTERIPRAIFFKTDGTLMYLVGGESDLVFQYTLSTPWDISTFTETGTFSSATQELDARDIHITSDGTHMYLVGASGDDINQYTLTTAWDITSATFVRDAPTTPISDTSPQGVYVSDDGARLYFTGNTDSIHQYDMGQAQQVTTLELTPDGGWSANDVGKKITAGGGSAFLTSAAGAFEEIEEITGTTFAAGEWGISGLEPSDTGLTPVSKISGYDISSPVYTGNQFTSPDSSTNGVAVSEDGTRIYLAGNSTDDLFEMTLSTPYDASTATQTDNLPISETYLFQVAIKPDGTRIYGLGQTGDKVYQYDLSTPFDLTTATATGTYNFSSNSTFSYSLLFNDDGTKMYIQNGNYVITLPLSTAWDVTTAPTIGTADNVLQGSNPLPLIFNVDGTKVWQGESNTGTIYELNLSTAYDFSTATYDGVSYSKDTLFPEAGTLSDWQFSKNGTKLYVLDSNDKVYEYDVGSASGFTGFAAAVTNSSGQIDSSTWLDINAMTADESVTGGEINYAVSTDDRTTWKVIDDTDGVRSIVRDNSGTWQYNSNATYGSETWTASTINDEKSALEEAMAVSANKMNKTQLDAVSDANHYTLGDTLDLAMMIKSDAAGNAVSSDGVEIDYDAQALNQGAVLGTDYDFDFPTNTTVRITSNAAQNLKIKVV